MSSGVHRYVRQWVPPIVGSLLRKLAPQVISFQGDYPSWKDAENDATGYSSRDILNRVVAATRKVASGEAAYERDSVLFERVEYSWPLLASLLQIAVECGSLRVVDFGGALGSTWRQNKVFLSRLRIPIRWCVVEQPAVIEAGKAEFETDVLRFSESITSACEEDVDAILFCGSLCYVADPYVYLHEARASGAKYLVIDRLPIVAGRDDRIMVQAVSEPIYVASYPVRMFGADKLFDDWLKDWRVIEQWECDLQLNEPFRYRGFFLERR